MPEAKLSRLKNLNGVKNLIFSLPITVSSIPKTYNPKTTGSEIATIDFTLGKTTPSRKPKLKKNNWINSKVDETIKKELKSGIFFMKIFIKVQVPDIKTAFVAKSSTSPEMIFWKTILFLLMGFDRRKSAVLYLTSLDIIFKPRLIACMDPINIAKFKDIAYRAGKVDIPLFDIPKAFLNASGKLSVIFRISAPNPGNIEI